MEKKWMKESERGKDKGRKGQRGRELCHLRGKYVAVRVKMDFSPLYEDFCSPYWSLFPCQITSFQISFDATKKPDNFSVFIGHWCNEMVFCTTCFAITVMSMNLITSGFTQATKVVSFIVVAFHLVSYQKVSTKNGELSTSF